jgi:hypothetical protein
MRDKALDAKDNLKAADRVCASILYGTEKPTRTQVKNVSATLGIHRKKRVRQDCRNNQDLLDGTTNF